MTAKNAIDWHTQIADDFDEKYTSSRNFRERFAVWTPLVDKYSDRNGSVLDLGCGSGVFSFYLAERNKSVLGLDGSEEMLRICERKKEKSAAENVDFAKCDINSFEGVLAENVDLIVCSSVLEYLDDLDRSLEMIAQSLNEKGLFMFSMPNKQSIWRKLEPISFKLFGRPRYYQYVKHVCTLGHIKRKLGELGFELLESEFYGSTPFLSRFFRKLGLASTSDNLFVAVARRLS